MIPVLESIRDFPGHTNGWRLAGYHVTLTVPVGRALVPVVSLVMGDSLPMLPAGTVTFLFSDIEGSTRLLDDLGEQYVAVLELHREVLRAAFERHGGVEVGTEGDSFFVAFARASDAIAAAADAQRGMAEARWPAQVEVRVRVGLHTGQPVVVGRDYVGMDVHRAARIMSAAHGGQVVVSHTTRDLAGDDLPAGVVVRGLGEHRLKDLTLPQTLYELVIAGLVREFPPIRTLENRPTNLPTQPTPLVGRESEVSDLTELMARPEARVITLTGPGGVGKTRLAMQVAAESIDAFRSGVFFINLAAVQQVDLVLSTVARTLGLAEVPGLDALQSLGEDLARKEMVILLDNFEHVVEAASGVSALAQAAPGVRWIVTSRAALRIAGEREYPVSPLSLPDDAASMTPLGLSRFAAVELFVQRAQAVKPGFELTDRNAAAVAQVCWRLDGLPLALELAAARIKLLGPEDLLARLDDRLRVLTGGLRDAPARQQTLRAAIGWSHDLLPPRNKTLFQRLAVFDGGWTLEAAEQVCADTDTDIFDGLASLVDNSLVRQDEAGTGESRFWMLETISAFAAEQLEQSGDAGAIRDRHAEFYLALAKAAEYAWRSDAAVAWMPRLEADVGNLRIAIAHLIAAGDYEAAASLVGALGWYWQTSLRYQEGRRLISELQRPDAEISRRSHAVLLLIEGVLAEEQGESYSSRETLEQAVEGLSQVGETALEAYGCLLVGGALCDGGHPDAALTWFMRCKALAHTLDDDPILLLEAGRGLAIIARRQGNHAEARALLEAGVRLAPDAGVSATPYALSALAALELDEGRYDAAVPLLAQAVEVCRDIGDHRGRGMAMLDLATAHLLLDDTVAATTTLAETLPDLNESGSSLATARALLVTAGIAQATGDSVTATELLGAASTLHNQTGTELYDSERRIEQTIREDAWSALSEAGLNHAIERGSQLSTDQAVDRALQFLEQLRAPSDPP